MSNVKRVYKLKIYKKSKLIELGLLKTTDAKEFINIFAGKEVTLNEVLSPKVCTCLEHPEYAIYDMFIEHIFVPNEESTSTLELTSFGTIAKSLLFSNNDGSNYRHHSSQAIRLMFEKAVRIIKYYSNTNLEDFLRV